MREAAVEGGFMNDHADGSETAKPRPRRLTAMRRPRSIADSHIDPAIDPARIQATSPVEPLVGLLFGRSTLG
jgi:hypothetical protein